jgi:tetratricopeptide (TPR) repeat protein
MADYPRRWPPEGGATDLDPVTARQLAALGYVSFAPGPTQAKGGDPKARVDLMRFLMTGKFDLSLAQARTRGARLQAQYGWAPSLLQYLVEYYDGLGYRWEADALLAAAAAAHPDRGEITEQISARAVLRADKEALAARIRAAVRRDPSSADARFDLGLTLRYLGKLPEAEEALRAAAGLAPEDLGIVRELAHVLRVQGRVAEAIAVLEAPAVRDPAMRCELGRFRYVHGVDLEAAADNLESCWGDGEWLIGEDLAFLQRQRFPR